MNWNELLRQQITEHWTGQLRARLDGLTNDEYFWEPAPACWNVHPHGASSAPVQAGTGAMTIDFAMPEPTPPPFTTIAWRLGHVIVGVLAVRNATHFGGAPTSYQAFEYAATATEALAQLDAEYATWLAGVESVDLAQPCGEAEGHFASRPMAALVLHIHRELIHHLSEVCVLRDLYVHTEGKVS